MSTSNKPRMRSQFREVGIVDLSEDAMQERRRKAMPWYQRVWAWSKTVPAWKYIGALGLLCLLVTVSMGLYSFVRQAPKAPPLPPLRPAPHYEPPVHLRTEPAKVEILDLPAQAEIRLDGRIISENPFHVSRSLDHVVELRAPGYERRQIRVNVGDDTRFRADMTAITKTNRRPKIGN